MRTIEFRAVPFDSLRDAMEWSQGGDAGMVVQLDGSNYVMDRAETDRLSAAGVEFSLMFDHLLPTGESRIVGVPVN